MKRAHTRGHRQHASGQRHAVVEDGRIGVVARRCRRAVGQRERVVGRTDRRRAERDRVDQVGPFGRARVAHRGDRGRRRIVDGAHCTHAAHRQRRGLAVVCDSIGQRRVGDRERAHARGHRQHASGQRHAVVEDRRIGVVARRCRRAVGQAERVGGRAGRRRAERDRVDQVGPFIGRRVAHRVDRRRRRVVDGASRAHTAHRQRRGLAVVQDSIGRASGRSP